MLRRLHPDQPDSFEFTPANLAWAREQITKYPKGRQASAIIPLLWRAQEQEGWLSRAAIEHVAEMLDLAFIRALEVATFYFMFQLQPVGSVAHVQICGTTSCMICGAEDLIAVCQDKIAKRPHELSEDGKFSWEEVECLGACANAPMAQIGKDYYEDLTTDGLGDLLDRLASGEVPQPGPQNGRFASEPLGGITTLKDYVNASITLNASARLATDIGDTVKRIDGSEVPLEAPWADQSETRGDAEQTPRTPQPAADIPVDETGIDKREAPAVEKARPETRAPEVGEKPAALDGPREGGADDLKKIKGIGPKLEDMLHGMGIYHFDQIAAWTDTELAWVDDNLEGFRGRASRDEWISQARDFAKDG